MSTSELSGGTRQTARGGGRRRGVTCHGLTSHPEGSNYTFQAMKAWKSHGSCESCVVKQTSSHFV